MKIKESLAALSVLALAAGPLAAVPAMAQDEVQPPAVQEELQPAMPGETAAAYDEQKLRSFVTAFLQVDQINRQYAAQMQEAESPEAQQQVQSQAIDEMVAVVQGADGISVEEYNSIIETAQASPELAQQINELIREQVE